MAYQRKTWQSGDTITTVALNNIESGIASVAAAVTELQADVEPMQDGVATPDEVLDYLGID